MPTTPSPHDLAVLNILQDKLADWEKAEEDLFLRRQGWYCHNKHIEDRAYVSWAMTQSRDFGSAVWRWLRLDDWDAVQTPRMKGLYETFVAWLTLDGIKRFTVQTLIMTLTIGDWDQVPELSVGRNMDILQEWKWNQGTLRPDGVDERTPETHRTKPVHRRSRVYGDSSCQVGKGPNYN